MSQKAAEPQVGQRRGYPACVWVVGVFLIALAVRLAAFAELSHSPFFEVLLGDAQGYDLWAQKIAAGDWKGGDQVFYQAPAYPYFLAVVYKVLGHSPIGVRVIQCVLGALAAGMLTHAGRRFFGPVAGLFAGLIYALFPIAIFYDLTLQKSSLDGVFMAGVLCALGEVYARGLSREGGLRGFGVCALLVGAGAGLLVLTRENALALVPVLAALVVWFAWWGGVKARAVVLSGFLVALVVTLSPVAIRNHSVSGEWVLTTSQAGPNFYIGNHAGADGTYQPLKPGRGTYRYERADAVDLAQKAVGKELTATEVSAYWMGQSTSYIRENPGSWALLMLRKAGLLVNSLEAGDTEDPYSYGDYSWTLRVTLGVLSMGTLLGLAAIAFITPGGRAKAVYGVGAIVLVFGASVVAFYVFGRYRFPMAPGLALLAGYGVSRVLDLLAVWLTPAESGGETAAGASARVTLMVALGGFAGVWLLAGLPLLEKDGIKAVTYNNVASELIGEKKDPAVVLPLVLRAIDLSPRYASAYNNLGALLEETRELEKAALAYTNAVEFMPELTGARYNLGRVLIESGQKARALEVLEEGIRREPENASFWVLSAKALMQMKKPDMALAAMQKAVTLAPRDADVMNSLGVMQAQTGRLDLAQESFGKAAQLNPRHANARVNRARALIGVGRRDDAFMELSEHLANYPDDGAAREMLNGLRGK